MLEVPLITKLTHGTIVRNPTHMPGMHQLMWHPELEAIQRGEHLLNENYPGVLAIRNSGTPARNGLYLPHNLLNAGKDPAILWQNEPDATEATPSGLKLKEYQRRSVTACRRVDRERQGILVGAEPGLGKTITALQSLWLDGFLGHSGLVVGPLAAFDTWCTEDGDPKVHYGLTITPIESRKDYSAWFERGGWFFIHYDILNDHSSAIFDLLKPSSIIFDESHCLMNPMAKRTKAALLVAYCRSALRRILLSGTPIPKTRMDLWSQLAIAQPNQWGGRHLEYGVRYAGGRRLTREEGQGHWEFEGRTNTEELRARLAGVFLRFTKADVPNELPGLHRHRIEVELDPESQDKYNRARADIHKYLQEVRASKEPKTFSPAAPTQTLPHEILIAGVPLTVAPEGQEPSAKALQLVATTTLKSLTADSKVADAIDLVTQYLVHKHARIVVFTWKIDAAKKICAALKKSLRDSPYGVFGPIDGTHKIKKRGKVIREFVMAKQSVLVATRGSLAVSVNPLRYADALVQTMPDWNPDGNLQAEARLHREGRTGDVHCYYLLCPGTVDDRVLELIRQKAEEQKAISPEDRGGLNLVADLDPSYTGEDVWSVDEILSFLEGVEI